ncbi:hypothetical protein OROHE_012205 [Orobanche hederae]
MAAIFIFVFKGGDFLHLRFVIIFDSLQTGAKWSLPEIKDCLEEAGFRSVHFWIRSMPDSEQIRCTDGFSAARDVKYEEATSFQQQDSWNAYIVGIA